MSGLRQMFAWAKKLPDKRLAMAAVELEHGWEAVRRKNNSPAHTSSRRITGAVKIKILELDSKGFNQHEIAQRLGINQGRVNEVLLGRR